MASAGFALDGIFASSLASFTTTIACESIGASFQPCVVSLAAMSLAQLLHGFLCLSSLTLQSQAALDSVSEASLDGAIGVYHGTALDLLALYLAHARSEEIEARGAKERGVLINSYNYLAYACAHYITYFSPPSSPAGLCGQGLVEAMHTLHLAADELQHEHMAEQQRVVAKLAGRIKLSVDGVTVVSGRAMTTKSRPESPANAQGRGSTPAPAASAMGMAMTTPGGGIYGLAQKLGALGDASPPPPTPKQQQGQQAVSPAAGARLAPCRG